MIGLLGYRVNIGGVSGGPGPTYAGWVFPPIRGVGLRPLARPFITRRFDAHPR